MGSGPELRARDRLRAGRRREVPALLGMVLLLSYHPNSTNRLPAAARAFCYMDTSSNTCAGSLVMGPITLRPDGTVEIAPGASSVEAAAEFWHYVQKFAPAHTHARLIAKMRELAALKRHKKGESWTTLNVPNVLLSEIDDELTFIKARSNF